MAQTPRRRTPRKHIPALPPLRLEAALDALDKAPLSKDARRQLAAMLKAASNPDNEAPEVVMRTLPPDRQMDMQQTINAVALVNRDVTARGSAALLAMSDAEFDALVAEADDGTI